MSFFFFFFFNDTATTEIYTLSLHDALPISATAGEAGIVALGARVHLFVQPQAREQFTSLFRDVLGCEVSEDRKSTRLNSSHLVISYAVFCLKKKKKQKIKLLVRTEFRHSKH